MGNAPFEKAIDQGRLEQVEIISCYLRLSSFDGTSPSDGIVRLTVSRDYVERYHAGEAMTPYFSGLAGYLYALRHRDQGYERAGISIEPIVRVEDHLKALRPDIETLVHQVNRMLRAGRTGVTA